MAKEFLNEIKNRMEAMNHEQVGYLLNIHSLYIANDSEIVQFMTGMTLEEWTFLRISKITNEKDEQIGGFYVKQIVSRYNSSNAFSS